ncbi:MAG: hypothetical protein L0H79_10305 [Intrasporangium sp.]|uniref:hypothetical protein n=1 Tax=Intrasporangium sp. TaxID=1925024 RepID=UPI002648CC3E|nr:hypothetical protein [Intrasporangium sp.]MDN5796128.1 hypothetical protein [Intrasporangium sp.]
MANGNDGRAAGSRLPGRAAGLDPQPLGDDLDLMQAASHLVHQVIGLVLPVRSVSAMA